MHTYIPLVRYCGYLVVWCTFSTRNRHTHVSILKTNTVDAHVYASMSVYKIKSTEISERVSLLD